MLDRINLLKGAYEEVQGCYGRMTDEALIRHVRKVQTER